MFSFRMLPSEFYNRRLLSRHTLIGLYLFFAWYTLLPLVFYSELKGIGMHACWAWWATRVSEASRCFERSATRTLSARAKPDQAQWSWSICDGYASKKEFKNLWERLTSSLFCISFFWWFLFYLNNNPPPFSAWSVVAGCFLENICRSLCPWTLDANIGAIEVNQAPSILLK